MKVRLHLERVSYRRPVACAACGNRRRRGYRNRYGPPAVMLCGRCYSMALRGIDPATGEGSDDAAGG